MVSLSRFPNSGRTFRQAQEIPVDENTFRRPRLNHWVQQVKRLGMLFRNLELLTHEKVRNWLSGPITKSGVRINERSALALPAQLR